jgi:hypothetical protein
MYEDWKRLCIPALFPAPDRNFWDVSVQGERTFQIFEAKVAAPEGGGSVPILSWISDEFAKSSYLVFFVDRPEKNLERELPEQSARTTHAPRSGTETRSPSEQLRLILDQAQFEPVEPGEESSFEREIAVLVREHGAGALASIYRALFEWGETAPEAGAALLEALALLPRKLEHAGRASIFRASLLHEQPAIRFVAARALLRLRGALTRDALRVAAARETHAELKRDLASIMEVLDGAG